MVDQDKWDNPAGEPPKINLKNFNVQKEIFLNL